MTLSGSRAAKRAQFETHNTTPLMHWLGQMTILWFLSVWTAFNFPPHVGLIDVSFQLVLNPETFR